MQLGWEANITRLPLGVVGRGLWGGEHKAVQLCGRGKITNPPSGWEVNIRFFFFFFLLGG